MLTLVEILQSAVEKNAADIFIIAGAPPICKLAGGMVALSEERLFPDSSEAIVRDIYQHAGRDMDRLMSAGDDDFSFTVQSLSRFRVSTYKQRGSLAAVIRIIPFGIPDYQTMMIPDEVMSVAKTSNGLILITGAAGSGKSTTLACIIDRINATKAGHIITLEDPIEYLHRNKKSLVSQREVSLDSQSYVTALYACLRQSPDVILLGEMRDLATIQTALTAAETG
ncbi:MAG: Flp pilus assembly complex ATPase component TadA, partial [Peptococcaceae bacterium]|nr:Flp pilus assembly complex ATPase component TadA [Peptococcaceae bacterium]